MDYEPQDIDNIYNNQLVKKMAEAEAWITWANVMGKYEGAALINGASINYGDMQSKGETMRDTAKEEMLDLMEPLGIDLC